MIDFLYCGIAGATWNLPEPVLQPDPLLLLDPSSIYTQQVKTVQQVEPEKLLERENIQRVCMVRSPQRGAEQDNTGLLFSSTYPAVGPSLTGWLKKKKKKTLERKEKKEKSPENKILWDRVSTRPVT